MSAGDSQQAITQSLAGYCSIFCRVKVFSIHTGYGSGAATRFGTPAFLFWEIEGCFSGRGRSFASNSWREIWTPRSGCVEWRMLGLSNHTIYSLRSHHINDLWNIKTVNWKFQILNGRCFFFAMFNVEPGVFVANNPTNRAFFTKRWIQNLSATYEIAFFVFFLLDGYISISNPYSKWGLHDLLLEATRCRLPPYIA